VLSKLRLPIRSGVTAGVVSYFSWKKENKRMKNINDLLNQWQDGVENAQPDSEDFIKEEELRQLYEVAGICVRTGIVAGQLTFLCESPYGTLYTDGQSSV
jgi:hypothetical protein